MSSMWFSQTMLLINVVAICSVWLKLWDILVFSLLNSLMSFSLIFDNGGGFEYDISFNDDSLCCCERYDFPSDADFSALPGVIESEEGFHRFVGLQIERVTRRKTYFRIIPEETEEASDTSESEDSEISNSEDDANEEEETCSEESESERLGLEPFS